MSGKGKVATQAAPPVVRDFALDAAKPLNKVLEGEKVKLAEGQFDERSIKLIEAMATVSV